MVMMVQFLPESSSNNVKRHLSFRNAFGTGKTRKAQHLLAEGLVPSVSSCSSALVDKLLHWQSDKVNVFQVGSYLDKELRQEAAMTIQTIVRERLSRHPVFSDSDFEATSEPQHETDEGGSDDQDPVNVAAVRAFFHTIDSNSYAKSERPADEWTNERLLTWISNSLDLALGETDTFVGAKIVWREWASIEKHIPASFRKGIVTTLDSKLHSKGFPSLWELVA